MQLEFYDKGTRQQFSVPYSSVLIRNGKATGLASFVWQSCVFKVTDVWTLKANELLLERKVALKGSAEGGFMSSISLYGMENFSRKDADFFVPGMIYKNPDNLTRTAIGGVETQTNIRIREDRLPAPLFATMFKDGSAICVLDPNPKEILRRKTQRTSGQNHLSITALSLVL